MKPSSAFPATAAVVAALLSAPGLADERAAGPVVVELFTAEGCGGCMAANEFAGELTNEDGVLVLTYGVGYWDYLGWPDSVAQPEFFKRQRAYAMRLPNERPYTPQMVVDGHVDQAGFNREVVRFVIDVCKSHVKADPNIEVGRSARSVRVDLGAGEPLETDAEVWLLAFSPGSHAIEIGGGENAGRTMVRHNVVHSVLHLGRWNGAPAEYEAPALEDAPAGELGYAVLVQNAEQGAMIATGYVLPD